MSPQALITNLKLIKKVFFVLIFGLGLCGLGLVLAWYSLDQAVRRELPIGALTKQLQNNQGSLYIKVQGVEFSLTRGIVFKGIKAFRRSPQAEQKDIAVFRARVLVLQYNWLNWLRSRPALTNAHVQQMEVLTELSSWSDLHAFLLELSSLQPAPSAVIPAVFLPSSETVYYFDDFSASLPESGLYNKGGNRKTLRCNCSIRKEDQGWAFTLEIQDSSSPLGSGSGRLLATGSWQNAGIGLLRFRMQELSLETFMLLLNQLPGVEQAARPEIGSGLGINKGLISGLGSMEQYASNATGFHVKAELTGLDARLLLATENILSIKSKLTSLEYTSGWQPDIGPTFYELKISNPLLHFEGRYQRQVFESDENAKGTGTGSYVTEIKSELRLGRQGPDNQAVLKGFQKQGSLQLHLQTSSAADGKDDTQNVTLKAEGLKVDSLLDQNRDLELVIDSLVLRSDNDDQNNSASLQGQGRLGQAPWKLDATGNFLAHKSRYDQIWRLEQDWDLKLVLRGLNIQKLATASQDLHAQILYLGSRDEAPRAEDYGALWEKRFSQSFWFQSILLPADIKIQLALRDIQSSGGLPQQLDMQGIFKNASLDLRLAEDPCPAYCNLHLVYKLNLGRAIPRHDLELIANNDQNTLAFPDFTGSPRPPASWKFRFLAVGDGWLPGDLVHRSFSRLQLEANDVEIMDKRYIQLMRYGTNQTHSAFRFKSLDLKYGGDGPRVEYYLNGTYGEAARIQSQARLKIGTSGQSMLYFYNENGSSNRSLPIRFAANNSWSPAL
ncbi:MAG: hypothetical protein KDK39_09380 [Leptospiraceae bacterium]|nr:hypothetical protein [Leptospiraceae bacterium]